MSEPVSPIPIGSDHAGFSLKEFLKTAMAERNYEVQDFGTFSEASMDYPDVAHPVAKSVNDGRATRAVLICGSGNGMAITANKYQGVRAALCWNAGLARLARQHNNANILCLPARFITQQKALNALLEFLETPFEGGRHEARVNKIDNCL